LIYLSFILFVSFIFIVLFVFVSWSNNHKKLLPHNWLSEAPKEIFFCYLVDTQLIGNISSKQRFIYKDCVGKL